MKKKPILLFVANEVYFFISHRLPIAQEAQSRGYDVHLAAPGDHVWAPAGFSTTELERLRITFHEVPMSRRGTHPLQELKTFFTLLRIYRDLQSDIVHHLTIKPNLYGGLAARLARLPAVVSAITGLGQMFVASGVRLRLLQPFVLRVMRLALGHRNARVIIQNISDRDFLVKNSVVKTANTVLIKGSGVDLSQFKPVPEPDCDPIVILPSRLIWEKGIQEFVDAARILRETGVAARFALVGNTHSSNPRAVPEAILQAWDEEGVVEWWGRREDMPQVMAESHIVCLPSKYGEGVPKVLLEAAAAGRPVVATDTPGCREVIEDGVQGLLIPVADSEALATALRRLILDQNERVAIGAAGRNRAVRDLDIAEVVACTLSIYAELRASSRSVR